MRLPILINPPTRPQERYLLPYIWLVFTLLLSGALHSHAQTTGPSGEVDTIGGAFVGYADGGNNASQFNMPMGLALDGRGNLLIADYGNNAVRSMRLSDANVSTLFSASSPVAVAATTNFIYVLNQSGGFISVHDRFGNRRENLLNGLGSPTALTVDTNGNIYVAEGGGVVRRINPAGSVTGFYRVTEGIPDLRGVAVFPDGKVAASDANAKVIWLFNDPSQRPTVLAGTKFEEGFADGPPGLARFSYPEHIALGPNNSLVVADRFNHRVRVVACNGIVTTLYGVDPIRWEQPPAPNSGVFPGWLDGSIDFAESRDPIGVAVSGDGTVFGSELYYHLIRRGSGLTFPLNCAGQTNGNGETNIVVPIPVLNPAFGWFPEGTTATISITASNTPSGFGPNTQIFYTLNGTEPTTNSIPVPMVNGRGIIQLQGPIDLSSLKVRAFIGTASSPVVSALPTPVPTPIINPRSGYYPMGVRILVTAINGFPNGTQLFYTTNGSEPSTNSLPVSFINGQYVIELRGGQFDLRSLRVKAFLGPNAGQTRSGEPVPFSSPLTAGQVGIPLSSYSGNLSAGVGATIVVPVVANLRSGQSLRSLQFVAELSSLGQAPPPGGANQLRVLTMSSNDFIQVVAASPNPPNNLFSSVVGSVNRLAVAYVGPNSGFSAANFATVAMLAIPIPANAREGDRYSLSINQVSGTSDGVDQSVPLSTMPAQEILVQNISYLVGDTSPAFWYNAGDFGNGILDNADVNNAFYASLGFRVPYQFTDLFNAMDVYPEDSPGFVGGDGQIRFLDWQTILSRSLGFSQNNFRRRRTAGGGFEVITTSLPSFPLMAAETLSASTVPTSGTWTRHASLSAGVIQNVPQSASVSVPIFVKAKPGVKISGMQFVASVKGPSDTVPIEVVRFVPASSIPFPNQNGNSVPGIGTLKDSVYCSWNLDSFAPGIEGTVQLGTIEFQVPPGATSLRAYQIRFSHADGASSSSALAQYDFESFRGAVWVNCLPLSNQDNVSDEWKTAFFGNSDAANAQGDMDADGDGFSNYQEYLGGLHPERKDSRFSFPRGRFAFRFVREEGKKYKVQKSADLTTWTDASATLSGPSGIHEYLESTTAVKTNYFYRVILVQ